MSKTIIVDADIGDKVRFWFTDGRRKKYIGRVRSIQIVFQAQGHGKIRREVFYRIDLDDNKS